MCVCVCVCVCGAQEYQYTAAACEREATKAFAGFRPLAPLPRCGVALAGGWCVQCATVATSGGFVCLNVLCVRVPLVLITSARDDAHARAERSAAELTRGTPVATGNW